MKALYLLPFLFVPFLQRSDTLRQTDTLHRSDTLAWPSSFGIGRPATPAELAALDISIRPDGKGLPPGSGSAAAGKAIYVVKCAACHGKTGTEGPYMQLVSKSSDSTRIK